MATKKANRKMIRKRRDLQVEAYKQFYVQALNDQFTLGYRAAFETALLSLVMGMGVFILVLLYW